MLITYTAILKTKKEIAPRVFHLQFSYPTDVNWSYQSGQYMIFHLPSLENEHPVCRLYSIASAPSQKNSLDFIIEIVPGGIGSSYIENMNEGDSITMQGPAGIFTLKTSDRDIVMLATGTGIAPMYSMIQEISNSKNQNPNIYLFWGLKYGKDIYLKQELDKLADENPNFQYSICLSREEKNIDDARCLKGRVTKGLENLTTDDLRPTTDFDYYLCGSPHVVESLRSDLEAKCVPKNQVYFEKFSLSNINGC